MSTAIIGGPRGASPRTRAGGNEADRSRRAQFAARCVQWARDDQDLQTSILPEHALPFDHGRARFRGYSMRPGRWDRLLFAALLSLLIGWLVLALHGSSIPWPPLRTIGWGLVLASPPLAAAAVLRWRSLRSPVLVVVDVGVDPVRRNVLLQQWEQARTREPTPAALWVFARSGFGPGALEVAETLRIRCFVAGGHGFQETRYRPRTGSTPSGSPGLP